MSSTTSVGSQLCNVTLVITKRTVIAYPFLALHIVLQYVRKNTSSPATSLQFTILAGLFSHSKHQEIYIMFYVPQINVDQSLHVLWLIKNICTLLFLSKSDKKKKHSKNCVTSRSPSLSPNVRPRSNMLPCK